MMPLHAMVFGPFAVTLTHTVMPLHAMVFGPFAMTGTHTAAHHAMWRRHPLRTVHTPRSHSAAVGAHFPGAASAAHRATAAATHTLLPHPRTAV
jgi:hypothetical protein